MEDFASKRGVKFSVSKREETTMNLGTRSGVWRDWAEALAKKRAWRRRGNVRTKRERRRFSMPDVRQAKLRGEEVTGWTYGNVFTRVFKSK